MPCLITQKSPAAGSGANNFKSRLIKVHLGKIDEPREENFNCNRHSAVQFCRARIKFGRRAGKCEIGLFCVVPQGVVKP